MSEPTLIQEQRAVLRRLHQTTAHHSQLTTAADAQWQQVLRAYEEAQARLAEIGEEQALRSVPTSPYVQHKTECPAQVVARARREKVGSERWTNAVGV